MPLTEQIRDKILRIEHLINFPKILSPGRQPWENLPMAPYSDLQGAVTSIVEKGRKVAIITGFHVPGGEPPATETDGPPGALILGEGLQSLGMEVFLITDEYTLPTLKAGMQILNLSEEEIRLICFPIEHSDQNHFNRRNNEEMSSPISVGFVKDFFHGPLGRDLTHLIYIERVGPNHTLESFLAQERRGDPPAADYETLLPPMIRNRCFNSRLEDITRFTAKTHFLIEFAGRFGLSIGSIGIGDRGNEIGAGRIPWEVFKENSKSHREPVFCCRMKTDFFVSCGISNWGGYALLAAVALAAGKPVILEKITFEQERRMLDHLIQFGPAIDGITGRQESSVDGLEFNEYMKVIEQIMEIALDRRRA